MEVLYLTEEGHRYEVFVKNMAKVRTLQQQEQGTATYGATQFADMTGNVLADRYEFKALVMQLVFVVSLKLLVQSRPNLQCIMCV